MALVEFVPREADFGAEGLDPPGWSKAGQTEGYNRVLEPSPAINPMVFGILLPDINNTRTKRYAIMGL